MSMSFHCPKGHKWEVEATQVDEMEAGISTCPECGAEGDTIGIGKSITFQDELPPPPGAAAPTPRLPTTVASTMDGRSLEKPKGAVPNIEGYEILGQLGRGGMGVVFKARQLSLDRVVAIKTIVEGVTLDSRRLARFRIEAEAVAQLNHSHIAQIYEVGEAQGVPFFAMEYVEGGSLDDQLKDQPPTISDAARMVEQLARAMHYAHQREIIHRDLKPANVLVTKDGSPKITDFGLAKRLDQDSGQTRTGAVMGTPSYMAPEQAAGLSKEVGPLADVYSLGALLYDLLAGRPPFRGESPADTVRQVMESDPVSLRPLNNKVPRDLETICLKCLEKEPLRRYASADELADDLQRFLNKEPIHARAIGPVGRTIRWCRRKPAVALLTGVVALCCLLVAGTVVAGYRNAVRENRETRIAQQKAVGSYIDSLDAINEFYVLIGSEEEWADDRKQLASVRKKLLQKARDHYQRLTGRESYLQQIVTDDGSNQKAREKLGDAWNVYGQICHELLDAATAHQAFTEAVKIREKLAKDDAKSGEHRRKLANGYMNLGIADLEKENKREAWKRFDAAQKIREELLKAKPDARVRRDLAKGYYNWGLLADEAEMPDEAMRLISDAAKQFKELAEIDPHHPMHGYRLAVCYRRLGEDNLNLKQAFELLDKAARILEELLSREIDESIDEWTEADRIQCLAELAVVYLNLGDLYNEAEQSEMSLEMLRQAERMMLEVIEYSPDSPDYQQYLEAIQRYIRKLSESSDANKAE